MKHITRDIDPADAQDLLERVPRACLAFAGAHGPHAQPIALVWQDGRYLAGIPERRISSQPSIKRSSFSSTKVSGSSTFAPSTFAAR